MTMDIEPLDYIEKTAFQERKAIIDKVNEIIDVIGPIEGLTQDPEPTAGHGEGYYVTSEGVKTYVDNGDAAEASARQSADAVLQTNIDSEATARSTADSNLQANIDSEASARALGDTTVQTNLNTEISDRQAAVTAEASARQSADAVLQTNIDSEATARSTADSNLQANIAAEATARSTADSNLQANIDSEASARALGDTTVQTNLDTEISDRQAADTTLQNNITAEATARINADATKQDALTAGDGIVIENNVIRSYTQLTSDQTQQGSGSLIFICINSSNLVFSGVVQLDGMVLAGFGITNVANSWMQVFAGPGDVYTQSNITLHLDNDSQTTIALDPSLDIIHVYTLIGTVSS